MDRLIINAAAFFIGFLLMVAAGHATADGVAWKVQDSSNVQGIWRCDQVTACNDAIGIASNPSNIQCSGYVGTRINHYRTEWQAGQCNLIRTREECGTMGGDTNIGSVGMQSQGYTGVCPYDDNQCEQGAIWGGPVEDAYDVCSSNGCALDSPIACSGDGTFCNSTLTGETCTNEPYPEGCPGDEDCDGYPDETDECPSDFAHLPGTSGCPCEDDDNDGVCNVDDQCPGTVGNLTPEQIANGCGTGQSPDSDGDGVPDDIDECPNTPPIPERGLESNGCYFDDGDGDGVRDSLDQCPNTPPGQVVESDGCAPGATPEPTPTATPGTSPSPGPTSSPGPSPGTSPGPTPGPTASACPGGQPTCSGNFKAPGGSARTFTASAQVVGDAWRSSDFYESATHMRDAIPEGGGACPRLEIDVPFFNRTYMTESHCVIAEENRPVIQMIMYVVWGVLALYIVFKA